MRTYGIQDYHDAKMVLSSEKTNYRGAELDQNLVIINIYKEKNE